MSDTGLDFSGIASEAVAALNPSVAPAEATPSAPQTTPQPVPLQTPQTPSAVTPEAPVTGQPVEAPRAVKLADEALFEVTLPDGSTELKTGREIREERLRHADYTRKTQELAKQRKEVEPILPAYQKTQQELAALQQLVANKELLKGFVQQAYPDLLSSPKAAAPGFNPEEIASLGQVEQLAGQKLQQLEQTFTQRIAALEGQIQQRAEAVKQELAAEHQTNRFAEEFTSHLNSVLKEFKTLDSEDGEVLRWKVLQARPQNLEEAKSLVTKLAKERDLKARARWEEMNKAQLVQQKKLETNSIEPPGGAGVQIQPKTYDTGNLGQDLKAISKDAVAYLEGVLRSKQ